MARKKDNTLIMLAAIFGAIFLVSQGYIDLGGGPVLAVNGVPTVTTGDGIQISVGTPTLEWYTKNAITGAQVDLSADAFQVTINGTKTYKTASATSDGSLGDTYEICVRPNGTYYGNCISGTIDKTVTKITVPVTKMGTATIWINNDPENPTLRNAEGSADDAIAASDTDSPTVCIQGSTADASYGDGAFLIAIDWNSIALETAPTFSVGTLRNDLRPPGFGGDANSTDTAFYEVLQGLTNQDTVCGTMTIQNNSTAVSSSNGIYIEVNAFDRALFTHSVSTELVQAYARPTTGADTNSATNATTAEYFTGS